MVTDEQAEDRLAGDCEAYAALAVAVAQAGEKREEVLAENGLDEARWNEIDERWQARLSAVVDEDEGEGVPELVARYSEAYRRAQQRLTKGGENKVMSIETFAKAMRSMQHGGGDPQKMLGAMGITLGEFLKASEHWTQRMASDADVRDRYLKALSG